MISDGSFRIIGGGVIDITYAPYQASLINTAVWELCGGAIISTTKIVTAAHCLKNITSPTQIQIRVGSNKVRAPNTTVYKAKKYAIHPKYNAVYLTYDVAVIELNSKLSISNTVKTVKLPRANENVNAGTKGLVTGWGFTNASKPITSPILLYVMMESVSQKTCGDAFKKNFPNQIIVLNSIFCAVGVNQTSGGTCHVSIK